MKKQIELLKRSIKHIKKLADNRKSVITMDNSYSVFIFSGTILALTYF